MLSGRAIFSIIPPQVYANTITMSFFNHNNNNILDPDKKLDLTVAAESIVALNISGNDCASALQYS